MKKPGFKEFLNKKDEKNQRIKMYFDYYKNLSPKTFKVEKEANKITIEIK